MRHTPFIVFAATLPLWLGGCALFGGGDDTAVAPTPTPVTVPTSPVVAVPNTTASTTTTETTQTVGLLPPDLISSTDPGQRVQGIQRNRPDPFALVPTTPSVEIPPSTTRSQPVPQLPTLSPSSPSPQNSGSSSGNGSLAPIPQLVPQNPSPLAVLPPPPQPELARAVQVTGVVQIGNTLHAIVNAPNEPSSRYVQAGQRLSNGQILVKRIEMNQGAEPVVVLEQYGIEVITAVGGGGSPAGDASQPTAAAIVSPPARG
jgi:hypothetical protein